MRGVPTSSLLQIMCTIFQYIEHRCAPPYIVNESGIYIPMLESGIYTYAEGHTMHACMYMWECTCIGVYMCSILAWNTQCMFHSTAHCAHGWRKLTLYTAYIPYSQISSNSIIYIFDECTCMLLEWSINVHIIATYNMQ